MQQLNHSKLLGVLAGEGGDYFIDTTLVTTKKFSRIKITEAATITDIKIRGVSVKTDRNYGALPVGFELFAGGDDYFDYVALSAGSAIGVLMAEDASVGALAVTVDGSLNELGYYEITVGFSNTGNAGSRKVLWQLRNDADEVVQSGEVVLFFLKGSGLTVPFYIDIDSNTADTGYELDIKLEGSDVWTTSAPFETTV
jgi:hypothetical protein